MRLIAVFTLYLAGVAGAGSPYEFQAAAQEAGAAGSVESRLAAGGCATPMREQGTHEVDRGSYSADCLVIVKRVVCLP